MKKRTVRDIDVEGKRVLVRVDFNVPLDDQAHVLDDLRIEAALPTIRYLREHEARVILCSHLGRPKGRVVDSLSLRPVAERLAAISDIPLTFAGDCIGEHAASAVAILRPGDVLLLENLRFHAAEEANDPEFARQLASLAEVYVNDAFGAAHRAHASTEGVTHELPAVAGLLMERETDYLARVVTEPERPVGAIIGGAKISDKMACVSHLLTKVDVLVIGGGMANTFLKAHGHAVGDSLVEDDQLGTAKDVVAEAERSGVELLLPLDVVVADRFEADADVHIEPVENVPDGWRIMDAGPRSVAAYGEALVGCRTVVWNGPLGVIEFPQFARGSEALAKLLAEQDAVVVVGGGETAALVRESGLVDRFDHVSTGGGAFLEFLEGQELPGVAALLDA